MERLYVNGRLTDLGSGQQHKVAPGCGGEETVRDQGLNGISVVHVDVETTTLAGVKHSGRRRNNAVNNEVQVNIDLRESLINASIIQYNLIHDSEIDSSINCNLVQ